MTRRSRMVWGLALLAVGLAAALAFGLFWAVAGDCPPQCADPYARLGRRLLAWAAPAQPGALFGGILALAAVVFVGAEAALLAGMFRLRRQPPEAGAPAAAGASADLAWAAAPAVLLVVLFGFTWQTLAQMERGAAAERVRITAIGHQWWWEFRYPDEAIVTANEMVVPQGATVEVAVESADVVHAFWAPELFGKVDALPGHATLVSFTPLPARQVVYGGQCAELCGTRHGEMRFAVIVQPMDAYRAWAENQRRPAAEAPGQRLFLDGGCAACHTIAGTPAGGQDGPDLTHLMSRRFIGGGLMENTAYGLALWLREPHALKPGNRMALARPLDDASVDSLVAYLVSLH